MDEYLDRLSNAIAAPRRPGRIAEIRAAFDAWQRYRPTRDGYGPAVIIAFGFVCAALTAAIFFSLS